MRAWSFSRHSSSAPASVRPRLLPRQPSRAVPALVSHRAFRPTRHLRPHRRVRGSSLSTGAFAIARFYIYSHSGLMLSLGHYFEPYSHLPPLHGVDVAVNYHVRARALALTCSSSRPGSPAATPRMLTAPLAWHAEGAGGSSRQCEERGAACGRARACDHRRAGQRVELALGAPLADARAPGHPADSRGRNGTHPSRVSAGEACSGGETFGSDDQRRCSRRQTH